MAAIATMTLVTEADAPTRLVFCLRRRADMSRAQFQAYWREHHAPLVAERAEVLGIVGYRQLHTVIGDAYDGIAELHTDRGARSDGRDVVVAAGQRLLDDEREFIDLERSPIWHAPEERLAPGPERGLRVTAVGPSPLDVGVLRRRLGAVEGGRRSNLLLTPTDRGPDPLAVARNSPAPHPYLAEIWLDDGTDPTAAVDELRGHLAAAGVDPGAQLVWCARSRQVVGHG